MQLSFAIIDFSLFYDGAVDVTRSQCTVSDTSGGSINLRTGRGGIVLALKIVLMLLHTYPFLL